MKNLIFIFGIVLFAVQGAVAQNHEKFAAYKNIGSATQYVGFEFTLDVNPKFITNFEINFFGEINSVSNMNVSYQHYGNWSELLTGFDFDIIEFSKFKISPGFKIGSDLKGFSGVLYFKEELRLISWKGHGTEKFSCRQKINTINLVSYQNVCKNSRRNGYAYFETQLGFNCRF